MEHRIKWIDVLKGLTIIIIYISCVGAGENITYNFVSTHQAALFFCAFGLTECFNKEENVLKYIIKKLKTLLIPCFVLAYLVLMLITIQYNSGLDFVKGWNGVIAKGLIRNTYAADVLWYLTCLFFIQVFFFIVKKVKYKWLIFLICLGLHIFNVLCLHSLENPHWYFNIDSALYYMIFYAIGYLVFPYVIKLFELDTRKKKLLFVISGMISLIYSAGVYFGIDLLMFITPSSLLSFVPVLRSVIIVWMYFVCARLLQEVKCLNDIGKNILYLCGCEYFLKIIITTIISIIGRAFVVQYPIHIFMYVGIALFLGNKYLVPIEKYIIGKVVREV